jgi:hypothetical protein
MKSIRYRSLRLPPIPDLLDGTIELPPDPKVVRQMKLVGGGSIALAGVSCLVLVGVLAYSMPRILWPIRLLGLAVLFVLFGASEWVLWMGIKPPALRADAIDFSVRVKDRVEATTA